MKANKRILALAAGLVLAGASSMLWSQGRPSSTSGSRPAINDSNGDGVCDITGRVIGNGQQAGAGQRTMAGRTWGPGNGTGNQGSGPKDGTGYGAQSGQRSGPQDGSQARIGRQGMPGAGAGSAGRGGRRGGRP